MTSERSEQQRREKAWEALARVEGHPQVEAWLHAADQQLEARQAFEERTTRRWKRPGRAAAAGIALALIGAGLLAYQQLAAQHYETRVGEQRDVLLADGSRITLNTNTAVSVRYSKHQRKLVLEHGEALFAVAKDAARPFYVAAAGTLTRALGTEFNVDVRRTRVTVSVLEGAVQVSTPADSGRPGQADPDATPYRAEALAKGQALEFRPKERVTVQAKADLDRINAWRTRRLEFSDTPLAEAVEEFNRYSAVRVIIGTRDLPERRVSGNFRIGDTEGFIYSLHEVLGIEAHPASNEVVLVQPAN